MSWLRVDDKFCRHPKVVDLSDAAFRLHVAAKCDCAEFETDGRVKRGAVGGFTKHPDKAALIQELERAGLWECTEDGWLVHDYLDYNPSHAELKAKREQAKERARKSRAHQVRANGARSSHERAPNVSRTNAERARPVRSTFANNSQQAVEPPGARAGAGLLLRSGSLPDLPEGNDGPGDDDASEPAEVEVFAGPPPDERALAIAAELRAHRCFDGLDAAAIAEAHESATMTAAKPIAWVIQAIRECVAKYANSGLRPEALRTTLAGFMLHARAPKTWSTTDRAAKAPQPPQDTPHDREAREVQDRERNAAAAILAGRTAEIQNGPGQGGAPR